MNIPIPVRHLPSLGRLAAQDSAYWAELLKAIRESDPSLSLSTSVAEKLAKAEGTSQVQEEISALVSMYVYYDQVRDDLPVEKFTSDFCAALIRNKVLEEEKESLFEDFLGEFLRIGGPVELSAKGLRLLYDEERLLSSARIISDMRPVFTKEVEQGFPAALIVHSLRINYSESGEDKDFFVALDARDLSDLRDIVDRALEKDRSLRTFLSEANKPVLGD